MPEPRTFRNWQAIAYCGLGLICLAMASTIMAPPGWPLWIVSMALTVRLVAAVRQHVIVHAVEVELHNVVRHCRVPLARITQLNVLYRHRCWQIRMYYDGAYADTFLFVNLAGFRLLPTTFNAPPADAPASVKELYALLAARMSASTPS
jgi:hypothetical protein